MRRTAEQNVTVWADGFGVWHARVSYDRNPMAAAQVAIWQAIAERQGSEAPAPTVVQDDSDPQVWHETFTDKRACLCPGDCACHWPDRLTVCGCRQHGEEETSR